MIKKYVIEGKKFIGVERIKILLGFSEWLKNLSQSQHERRSARVFDSLKAEKISYVERFYCSCILRNLNRKDAPLACPW